MITSEYGNRSFCLDLNKETKNIIDFLEITWENTETIVDFHSFVKEIFDCGLKDGSNWLDFRMTRDYSKERKEYLKDIGKLDFLSLDFSYMFFLSSAMEFCCIEQYVKKGFNFSEKTEHLINIISDKYSIPKNIQPKGWDNFIDDYEEYDGMEEFDHKKNNNLFKGFNSQSCGAGGFHERISLPNTMYNEVCQDRNRLYTLIGSIYAHGLLCMEHNNSYNFMSEYELLMERILAFDFSFKKIDLEIENKFISYVYKEKSKATAQNIAEFNAKCDKIKYNKKKEQEKFDNMSFAEQKTHMEEKNNNRMKTISDSLD